MGTVLTKIVKTKTEIAGVREDLEETGLNQNPGISGMSEDLDMISFDLPRDTENGVTHPDEQVEDCRGN